jgi:hypothetical protein
MWPYQKWSRKEHDENEESHEDINGLNLNYDFFLSVVFPLWSLCYLKLLIQPFQKNY